MHDVVGQGHDASCLTGLTSAVLCTKNGVHTLNAQYSNIGWSGCFVSVTVVQFDIMRDVMLMTLAIRLGHNNSSCVV